MSKAKADPRGWPDYTYPMTIIGQELNVAIDIAAQSLPTLNISIAASDVTLDVNIASSAVTLNVNIESISEGVTFNVAQSGTWTINAVQSGTWTINIGAPLDAEGNVETSIVKSVQLDVNIASSAVTLNINIESISEGVVFNVAQSGTWTVNAAQTGAWTINIGAPLDASGYLQTHIMDSVQLDVNIAASAVTLNVNIAESAVTLNVNIESISEGVVFNVAQSGDWTINAVQSGSWSINIESVTEGVTFDVNITGSTATLDVNIASSSVAINIKTETGANIVIDKLVESAYTEERHVLANNGDTPIMLAPGTSYRRGKYFPRGCRGFIHQIEVYCDNQDSIDRKLYIYVAPQPGMAPIISTSLTVPASSSPAWRSRTVNKYWNYDSLFIWVLSETSSNPRVGYDEGAPPDYYDSTDGATWFPANRRLWIRLNMTAQTVGDLPVTGTLNIIKLPNVSSRQEVSNVPVNAGTEGTIITVDGAGELVRLAIGLNPQTDNEDVEIRLYCDGEIAWAFNPLGLSIQNYSATTPGVQLLRYTAGGDIAIQVLLPFSFRRQFKVTALNGTSNTQYLNCTAIFNLVS